MHAAVGFRGSIVPADASRAPPEIAALGLDRGIGRVRGDAGAAAGDPIRRSHIALPVIFSCRHRKSRHAGTAVAFVDNLVGDFPLRRGHGARIRTATDIRLAKVADRSLCLGGLSLSASAVAGPDLVLENAACHPPGAGKLGRWQKAADKHLDLRARHRRQPRAAAGGVCQLGCTQAPGRPRARRGA
jgi:hypothetical protein